MKQKDVAMIIIIVAVSGAISLIVSKTLFTSQKARNQEVEIVDPITASFPTPSSKYFSSGSVDPTQPVQIGNNNNQAPFNGSSQ